MDNLFSKYIPIIKDNYLIISIMIYGYCLLEHVYFFSYYNLPFEAYISLSTMLLHTLLVISLVMLQLYLYIILKYFFAFINFKWERYVSFFIVFIVSSMVMRSNHELFRYYSAWAIAISIIGYYFLKEGAKHAHENSLLYRFFTLKKLFFYILGSFFLLIFIFFKVDHSYYNSVQVTFETEKNAFDSKAENLKYIGESENYFFFYNNSEQSPVVYAKEGVKKIKYSYSQNHKKKF